MRRTATPARRLLDRRVVITGASSGVGLDAARLFAQEGADLAVLARSADGLAEAVRLVETEGRKAHMITVDVADRGAAEVAVAEAARVLGGIDVFVSNAGTAGWGPFEQMTPEDFDRTMDITFTGAVNCIRAALPHLEAAGGNLVVTVSIAGKVPVPLLTPYTAAKHALRGFLGALRNELRHRGSRIRISMVHPAPLNTPFYDHATSSIAILPKPLRSTYRPEAAAQALVECAIRPRREVSVGGSAAGLALLAAVSMPLADLVLSTYGVWGAKSRKRAVSPGSLWSSSGKGRVHGSHGGRPSLWAAADLRTLRVLKMRNDR